MRARPSSASSRSTAASTDPFCSFDHTTTVVIERTERRMKRPGSSPLFRGAGRSPSSWTWNPLLRLAEQQHGLITLGQARSLGIGQQTVHRWASGPSWERLSDEVLRRRGSAPNQAQHVLAAVLDAGRERSCRSPAVRRGGGSRVRPWVRSGSSGSPGPADHSGHRAEIHTRPIAAGRWTTTLDAVPIVRPELLALHLFATDRAPEPNAGSSASGRCSSCRARRSVPCCATSAPARRNGIASVRRLPRRPWPGLRPGRHRDRVAHHADPAAGRDRRGTTGRPRR